MASPQALSNPFKSLRLAVHLTQAEVAAKANISRMAYIRTEQGMYTTPPQGVLSALAPYSETGRTEDLCTRYLEWVKTTRRLNGTESEFPCLPDHFQEAYEYQVGEGWARRLAPESRHPLVVLRGLGSSQISLCKALCLNPGPIHKFEKFEQREVPTQLLDALRDARYSERDIEYLKFISAATYDSVNGE